MPTKCQCGSVSFPSLVGSLPQWLILISTCVGKNWTHLLSLEVCRIRIPYFRFLWPAPWQRVGQLNLAIGQGSTSMSAKLRRSPLRLNSLARSKTHLDTGNRESKCQGFNARTFFAGKKPCRGYSKRARSPKGLSPLKTPDRLNNKPTSRQVMQQCIWPNLFGRSTRCAPAY